MYSIFRERFESLGCTLLTTEEELEKDTNRRKIFKIIATCGHERVTDYYSFVKRNNHACEECGKQTRRNIIRTPYSDYVIRFRDIGCTLLTTEDEYNASTSKQHKFKFIAKCGHQHETTYYTILESKTYTCRTCAIKTNAENRSKLLRDMNDDVYVKKFEELGLKIHTSR